MCSVVLLVCIPVILLLMPTAAGFQTWWYGSRRSGSNSNDKPDCLWKGDTSPFRPLGLSSSSSSSHGHKIPANDRTNHSSVHKNAILSRSIISFPLFSQRQQPQQQECLDNSHDTKNEGNTNDGDDDNDNEYHKEKDEETKCTDALLVERFYNTTAHHYVDHCSSSSSSLSSGNHSRSLNSTLTENEHHHHHPALHQVEHRAKEKGTLALSQHLAEHMTTITTKSTEQVGERILLERGFQGTKSTAERFLERNLQQTGERATERCIEQGLERASERAAERGVEQWGERAAEHAGQRWAQQTGEKGIKRALERWAERAGERTLDRGSEQALERLGKRSGERAVERLGEQSTERLFKVAGEKSAERAVERSSERGMERILGITSEKLTLRIGRGLMIALPVLGGFFAFYLFKSDYHRWLEEKRALPTLIQRKEKKRRHPYLPLVLFAITGMADFVDAFLHFGIAYGLLAQLGHYRVGLMERLSITCAVISTGFAVWGEILSLRARKRVQSLAKNEQ